MDYVSIKCPHCGKELKVPADAEKIVCMFCAEPIIMGGGTEGAPAAESAQEPAAVGEAKAAVPEGIFSFKISLDQMNAKVYPSVFENFQKVMSPFWPAFEKAASQAPERTAEEISDRLVSGYSAQVSDDDKKHDSNKYFDCRFTITALLIPAILERKNEASEKLADVFLKKWNEKYPKRPLGKASYDMILKGFKKKYCFVTTATCLALKKGDGCRELNMFRSFRDNWMLGTADGGAKVTEYYLFAPIVVSAINSSPEPEREYGRIWDSYLMPCLGLLETGENVKCEQKYERMMCELEEKWL